MVVWSQFFTWWTRMQKWIGLMRLIPKWWATNLRPPGALPAYAVLGWLSGDAVRRVVGGSRERGRGAPANTRCVALGAG